MPWIVQPLKVYLMLCEVKGLLTSFVGPIEVGLGIIAWIRQLSCTIRPAQDYVHLEAQSSSAWTQARFLYSSDWSGRSCTWHWQKQGQPSQSPCSRCMLHSVHLAVLTMPINLFSAEKEPRTHNLVISNRYLHLVINHQSSPPRMSSRCKTPHLITLQGTSLSSSNPRKCQIIPSIRSTTELWFKSSSSLSPHCRLHVIKISPLAPANPFSSSTGVLVFSAYPKKQKKTSEDTVSRTACGL